MKLKFHSDAWYNGKLIAIAGEVKDISDEFGFAQRWINRGAEEVPEEKPQELPFVSVDIPEVKEQNKKGKTLKGK